MLLYLPPCIMIDTSVLQCAIMTPLAPVNFDLPSTSESFYFFFFFFPVPLAGSRRELTMHFTLYSEYVAMVVARDLAWSAVKSPNIKGVLLTLRQWKLWVLSNCLGECEGFFFFFNVPFNYHASVVVISELIFKTQGRTTCKGRSQSSVVSAYSAVVLILAGIRSNF